jgi:hypothetical protein
MISAGTPPIASQPPAICLFTVEGRRRNDLTPIMSAVNWHYIHITPIYVKHYVRFKGETPIIC